MSRLMTLRAVLALRPIPGLRLVLLAGTGIILTFLWGREAFFFINGLVLVLMLADYRQALDFDSIEARRQFQGHFSQGQPGNIEMIIRNNTDRNLKVEVRDQPPGGWEAPVLKFFLPPRASRSQTYRVVPSRRGLFYFGPIIMRLEGPLGLVKIQRALPAAEEVKVYPRLTSLKHRDLIAHRRMAMHWGQKQLRFKGRGKEFDSLRDYADGDDPRLIHWKATARMGRPIIQECRPERNQTVMLLLDTGRLMGSRTAGRTKMDHALEACTLLAHAALSAGDQVGFLSFADRVTSFVPPKGTVAHLQSILDQTLRLEPELVEPQYERALLWFKNRVRRRSLVVLFTDILDEIASENLLTSMSILRPRHLPLCVTIRDAEWDFRLNEIPQRVRDVYEAAILHETLKQRRIGLQRLHQRGALVLDLAPGQLSTETLNRYLETKQKGLL